MLKVSGMCVSPFEVEAALARTRRCLKPRLSVCRRKRSDQTEGICRAAGHVRGPAIVALRCNNTSKGSLRRTIIRAGSSSYAELPKTATGKIQHSSCANLAPADVAPTRTASHTERHHEIGLQLQTAAGFAQAGR